MTSVKTSSLRFVGYTVDIGNEETCTVMFVPRPNGNAGYIILFNPYWLRDSQLCTALLGVFKHWPGKIQDNREYSDGYRIVEVELYKQIDNPRTACKAFGKKLGELLRSARYVQEVSQEPLNRHLFSLDGIDVQDAGFADALVRFLKTQVRLDKKGIERILRVVEERAGKVEGNLIVAASVYAPLDGTFLTERTLKISEKVQLYYLVDRNIWIQFE